MKMKKLCHILLLSVFCSSSLCYGAECCKDNGEFKLNYNSMYELEKDLSYLGSGCSARVYKLNYNGQNLALKIFRFETSKKSDREIETCEKILKYSKNNELGSGLMKVLGITKTTYTDKWSNKFELPTIVFEFIDGITLQKWLEGNNFKDTNSFIDDFCIPLVEAFKEYYKITGELKPEVLGENIMMREIDGKWKPVLIDYGPSSQNPIYWLYNTLSKCCAHIEIQDEKSKELSDFFDDQRSCGKLDQNISHADEILKKINEIRKN